MTLLREQRLAAYHEATHAFMYCVLLGKNCVLEVLITSDGNGHCTVRGSATALEEALCLIAGMVAEDILLDRRFNVKRLLTESIPSPDMKASDYHKIIDLFFLARDRDVDDVITDDWAVAGDAWVVYIAARVKAEYLVPNWETVERIALALLEKGKLTGDEVAALILDLFK
jgi:hypothetical protein